MRERAYFYINLLSQKGDESFLASENELFVSTENTQEKQDVREFVFDGE